MSEKIRIMNLTKKLMIELGVGTYYPMVYFRLNSLSDEQIRKIYKIIKEETKVWP